MKYEQIKEESLTPENREIIKDMYRMVNRRLWTRPPESGKYSGKTGPLFDLATCDRLIQGAIDTHIHVAPCASASRPLDGIDIGIQACEEGMEAVAYKSMSQPSSIEAYLCQKVVNQWAKEHNKKPTKIIGGVVLNHSVGGLNPEAVYVAARIGGRFVWTPNVDAAHLTKIIGQPNGIEVLDENDKVVPELLEVFELIKEYDLVLTLSHHSTKERFIMIDTARKMGIERILLVHVFQPLCKMNIEQMKIAASKGAYLEHCCLDLQPPCHSWEEFLAAVKEVGADHFILATDLGNWIFPPPVATFKRFLGLCIDFGIPEADVEKMAKTNARNLIF